MAASQHFLIFSFNIMATVSGAITGPALTTARLKPEKLDFLPGFFVAVDRLGVFKSGASSSFVRPEGITTIL
jgi:hypothetical protein